MLKIRKILLPDNTFVYQACFKNSYEQDVIEKYLSMLDVNVISYTYLENGGYIDYYFNLTGGDEK